MPTEPLFDVPARPLGQVRAALDAKLDVLRAGGADVPDDLAVVCQALADRVDRANGGDFSRGYVMLSAEYRAARRDLLEGLVLPSDGGPDSLESAIAEFRAATAGDGAGPVPAE
jgi:hypothetical protein